ncbi:MAG TPA: selenium-dependent molybdenum cofactor biosynthesis protein YqeB [Polyangia bacterium]
MTTARPLVVIRGAGDMATAAAHRLWRAGLDVALLERAAPTAIRRAAAFAEAVATGQATIEGVTAARCVTVAEARALLAAGTIPLLVDPAAALVAALAPAAVVDARMLKDDPGPRPAGAPLLVGLGPGFVAGVSCDLCIETQRGHTLGRVLTRGAPLPYTGVPAVIAGESARRVLRAPRAGVLRAAARIGDVVAEGAVLCTVDGEPACAAVGGIVRGLIPDGAEVTAGQKIGDVDPRGAAVDVTLISDKARAIAGGVLEAVLGRLGGRIP